MEDGGGDGVGAEGDADCGAAGDVDLDGVGLGQGVGRGAWEVVVRASVGGGCDEGEKSPERDLEGQPGEFDSHEMAGDGGS